MEDLQPSIGRKPRMSKQTWQAMHNERQRPLFRGGALGGRNTTWRCSAQWLLQDYLRMHTS